MFCRHHVACVGGQRFQTGHYARSDTTTFEVKIDAEYHAYIEGGLCRARQSLLESERLITSSSLFVRKHAASHSGLYLCYGRLHLLETRAGNSILAAAYWAKTQYWLLRKLESQHASAIEIERSLAITPQDNMAMLDKWDRRKTKGQGPKYLRELRGAGKGDTPQ